MRVAALAALAALGVVGCGGADKDGGGGEVVTFARTTPATGTGAAGATGAVPTPAPTVRPARAALFTIRVPAGWSREDSTLAGGLSRSEWRDPDGPGTSLLVDALAGATSSPEERGRRNRDRGAAKSGYRERRLEPVSLGGRPGFVWEYELPGKRIVDYFLNDCGDGYAVQGTASTAAFPSAALAFRAAAESLRSTHC